MGAKESHAPAPAFCQTCRVPHREEALFPPPPCYCVIGIRVFPSKVFLVLFRRPCSTLPGKSAIPRPFFFFAGRLLMSGACKFPDGTTVSLPPRVAPFWKASPRRNTHTGPGAADDKQTKRDQYHGSRGNYGLQDGCWPRLKRRQAVVRTLPGKSKLWTGSVLPSRHPLPV